MEGKTVLAGNIAKTLKEEGRKVLILNYDNKQNLLFSNGNPQSLINFLVIQILEST
jgi:cellulose biosynthesis protein BcsQ